MTPFERNVCTCICLSLFVQFDTEWILFCSIHLFSLSAILISLFIWNIDVNHNKLWLAVLRCEVCFHWKLHWWPTANNGENPNHSFLLILLVVFHCKSVYRQPGARTSSFNLEEFQSWARIPLTRDLMSFPVSRLLLSTRQSCLDSS